MKRIIILLFFLWTSLSSFATHILGGEISWQCLPSGEYQFTLVLYRDCWAIPLNTPFQNLATNANASGSIQCAKVSVEFISPNCNVTACNSGTDYGGVEKHTFKSAPVKLEGIPPATGWYFIWNSCCRPIFSANLPQSPAQGYGLRAIMYPYVPPGTSQALDADPCYNSSPAFLVTPNHYQCVNDSSDYKSGIVDFENDSLNHAWASPLQGANGAPPWASVSWNSGYGTNSQLPAGTNPASVDPHTGEISFLPNSSGVFVTCVGVDEYRNGQRISEVFRDMIIIVNNCPANGGFCANAPKNFSQVNIDQSVSDSLQPIYAAPDGSLEVYKRHLPVYLDDSVKFEFTAIDNDVLADCTPENIRISAYGKHMNGGTMNFACVSPCATLTSKNPNGSFDTTHTNTVKFDWFVNCNVERGLQEFTFEIENNSCPKNTVKLLKVLVEVVNPLFMELPKFDYNQSVINGAFESELYWTKPDTSAWFTEYQLWNRHALQGIQLLWSSTNYNDTFYVHSSPAPGWNQYWIRAVGGCYDTIEPITVIDTNSMILLTNTIGISEHHHDLSYYPQPMTDQLIVDGFKGGGKVNLKMINSIGQLVQSEQLQLSGGRIEADVSQLPPGIYVCVLDWAEGSTKIKLIKRE